MHDSHIDITQPKPALYRQLAQELQSLTLCGERFARRFTAQPLSLVDKLKRRFRSPDVVATLEAL